MKRENIQNPKCLQKCQTYSELIEIKSKTEYNMKQRSEQNTIQEIDEELLENEFECQNTNFLVVDLDSLISIVKSSEVENELDEYITERIDKQPNFIQDYADYIRTMKEGIIAELVKYFIQDILF